VPEGTQKVHERLSEGSRFFGLNLKNTFALTGIPSGKIMVVVYNMTLSLPYP
jgi:hypothetical protein